jgi:hypothetical protein
MEGANGPASGEGRHKNGTGIFGIQKKNSDHKNEKHLTEFMLSTAIGKVCNSNIY